MRRTALALWMAVALSSALMAAPVGAVPTISLLSDPTVTVAQGGSFTIDLAIDDPGGPSNVFAIDAYLSGMAAAGAVVTGGQSAPFHFAQFCTTTACFGQIIDASSSFFDGNDLSASGAYSPGDDVAKVATAQNTAAAGGDGSLDPGLAGVLGTHDPLDVIVNLTANVVGTHVLTFGGGWFDGTNALAMAGDTLTVNVVPEPGTALLMGLGLVGLAGGTLRRH